MKHSNLAAIRRWLAQAVAAGLNRIHAAGIDFSLLVYGRPNFS
jgi:hypothetical protein